MYQEINEVITQFDFSTISEERKQTLQELTAYIQERRDENGAIRLNFICTHNSRRSHLSQIWAQVAASHYQIRGVDCYSGGTEATAMYHMVKNTLVNHGFIALELSEGDNPIIGLKYDKNRLPIIAFSKTYDHVFNPESDFAAIMTCDSADQNCPLIIGADKRIALTYVDPKISDGTALQEKTYKERSVQIATELFYAFSQV